MILIYLGDSRGENTNDLDIFRVCDAQVRQILRLVTWCRLRKCLKTGYSAAPFLNAKSVGYCPVNK